MTRPVSYSGNGARPPGGFLHGLARGREMPANQEAEEALLGAMLANIHAADKAADLVAAEDFSVPAHARIFAACVKMRAEDRRPDPVSLRREFFSDVELEDVGGAQYLSDLASDIISVEAVPEYAGIIRDLAVKRRIIEAAAEIAEAAWRETSSTDAGEQIEAAETRLAGLNGVKQDRRGPKRLSAVIDDMHDHWTKLRAGDIKALEVGLTDFDRMLGGMMPGDLTVLGGRPGAGKTTCALTCAANVARGGKKVLIFSQEMSGIQVATGLTRQRIDIDGAALRRASLPREEMARAVLESTALKTLPIWVDDGAGLTIDALRRRVRQVRREAEGLDFVIIDYLQLMSAPTDRYSTMAQDVEYLTNNIKRIAKEEKVPILLLSQLSREVEKRDSKRPTMSDLRNSGSIEQDADQIALLFREEYYLQRAMPTGPEARRNGAFEEWEAKLDACRGVAEILIEKNRFGTTGVVKLHFNGARGLFEDAGPRVNGHAYRPAHHEMDDEF